MSAPRGVGRARRVLWALAVFVTAPLGGAEVMGVEINDKYAGVLVQELLAALDERRAEVEALEEEVTRVRREHGDAVRGLQTLLDERRSESEKLKELLREEREQGGRERAASELALQTLWDAREQERRDAADVLKRALAPFARVLGELRGVVKRLRQRRQSDPPFMYSEPNTAQEAVRELVIELKRLGMLDNTPEVLSSSTAPTPSASP